MTCKHDVLVKLADGWFCPDCGQTFAVKPMPPKEEEKPKKKKAKKTTE